MLEKIDDPNSWNKNKPCLYPGHNPPSHIVLEPGTYKHTCPSCGEVIVFSIPKITC